MTLIKKTANHKNKSQIKRLGQHHTVNKSYHKVYWPYLPLVLGMGAGTLFGYRLVIGSTIGVHLNHDQTSYSLASINISHNIRTAIVIILLALLISLVYRNYHYLLKLSQKSEKFLIAHYRLDLSVLLLIIIGLLLIVR